MGFGLNQTNLQLGVISRYLIFLPFSYVCGNLITDYTYKVRALNIKMCIWSTGYIYLLFSPVARYLNVYGTENLFNSVIASASKWRQARAQCSTNQDTS